MVSEQDEEVEDEGKGLWVIKERNRVDEICRDFDKFLIVSA